MDSHHCGHPRSCCTCAVWKLLASTEAQHNRQVLGDGHILTTEGPKTSLQREPEQAVPMRQQLGKELYTPIITLLTKQFSGATGSLLIICSNKLNQYRVSAPARSSVRTAVAIGPKLPTRYIFATTNK